MTVNPSQLQNNSSEFFIHFQFKLVGSNYFSKLSKPVKGLADHLYSPIVCDISLVSQKSYKKSAAGKVLLHCMQFQQVTL